MHDVQLEQRLRRALHEEATEHPPTVTIDQVEVRLRAGRRQRRFGQFGLVGAAAAFVVLVAGGAFLSGRLGTSSGLGVTPSPRAEATASPSADSTQALPRLVPAGGEFQVLREDGFDGTGTPGSVEAYPLGVIWPADRYRVSVVCRGPGNLDYALGGTIDEPTVGGAREECDGRSPQVIEFTANLPPTTMLLQPLVMVDTSIDWAILIEAAGVRDPWPLMAGRGPDGRVVDAVPGCGMSFVLSNGLTGADQCGGPAWPSIPDELTQQVRAGDALTFSMPDRWQIRDVSIRAVPAERVGLSVRPSDVTEVGFVEGLHEDVTVTLPDPGSFVLGVDATYLREGDVFRVAYFFGVNVLPGH